MKACGASRTGSRPCDYLLTRRRDPAIARSARTAERERLHAPSLVAADARLAVAYVATEHARARGRGRRPAPIDAASARAERRALGALQHSDAIAAERPSDPRLLMRIFDRGIALDAKRCTVAEPPREHRSPVGLLHLAGNSRRGRGEGAIKRATLDCASKLAGGIGRTGVREIRACGAAHG